MKLILVFAGVVAAGAVGGVTAHYLMDDAPVEYDAGNPDPLVARVDSLENSVARLTEEIRLLRDAAHVPADPGAAPAPAEAAEADAVLNSLPPAEEEIAAKVLATLEERAQKDREARQERMEAAAAQASEAILKRLETDLGLTAYQSDELAQIFEDRRKAMSALRDKYRKEGERPTREDFQAMRDEMKQIRDDTDAKLKDLLSEDQYKSLKKAESQRNRNQGRRGGRGGRGR